MRTKPACPGGHFDPSMVSGLSLPNDTPSLRARSCTEKLFKELHRILFGKPRRHSIELWPYLRLTRSAAGGIQSISIKGHAIPLVPIETLAEPAGPDLHIIATGPSIATINYRRLPSSRLLGVNGAIELTRHYPELHFDLYCIIDYTFITGRPDIAKRIVNDASLTLITSPKCLFYLIRLLGVDALNCRIALIEDIAERYNEPTGRSLRQAAAHPAMHTLPGNAALGFSQDIHQGVYRGGTVAFVALQVGAALGYEKIYLHGVDIGNADTQPRFYETPQSRQGSHLIAEYSGIILPSFQLAAEVLRARKIVVENLSPVSALPESIFPKTDAASLYYPASNGSMTRHALKQQVVPPSGRYLTLKAG